MTLIIIGGGMSGNKSSLVSGSPPINSLLALRIPDPLLGERYGVGFKTKYVRLREVIWTPEVRSRRR